MKNMPSLLLKNLWVSIMKRVLLIGIIVISLVLPFPDTTHAAAGETTRISVASNGTQANETSNFGSISAEGRFVAFMSQANNLVNGDENSANDVFFHDRATHQTTLISKTANGETGNDASGWPSISGDGCLIAYESVATDLVAGDSDDWPDVYVYNCETGQTERVSLASDGTPGNVGSGIPSISADGRYVAFASRSSNLVANDTNAKFDIFVNDRETGNTERVSVTSNGAQANGYSALGIQSASISDDGRYVTFFSGATNLVASDTNQFDDIFVHDRVTGQTTRVSVASNGMQSNGDSEYPSISADGCIVAFNSEASNLVAGDTNGESDVFVHDCKTGKTTRISTVLNGITGNSSTAGLVSANGRYVAYLSGDIYGVTTWHVYVHDRETGQSTLASVASDGTPGNVSSGWIDSLSADGKFVVFRSSATNLVAGDTNELGDLFVHQNAVTVQPSWTVMVYLDGDNDLDGSNLTVLNQLENAAQNENINIVAVLDRLGNNNSAYYKVKQDANLNQLAAYTEGKDRWNKGELNMGAATTLSDFVVWARTTYPAQHYALIIKDHGTGLGGTAFDQTSGDDRITIKELGDSLSAATSNGANKLDILFADSCLMGMIETQYQVRNFANIFIGGENLTYGPTNSDSLPYTNYLNTITTSTTPHDLATRIVTQYANWLDSSFPDMYGYTLSAVDLTNVSSLVTKVSALSSALRSQMPASASQILLARDAAQKFDSSGDQLITSADEYVDLADLADQLMLNISDSAIQNAALDVIAAVNDFVIANVSKAGTQLFPSTALDPNRVYGVSIFFPNGQLRRSFYNGPNIEFASGAIWSLQQSNSTASDMESSPGWGDFLVDYVSTVNPSAADDPNPPALISPKLVGLPMVSHIGLADANPTSATSVNFSVVFSNPVTGIDPDLPFDDFSLHTTGVSGATITGVSGSGASYTVAVDTGSGNGTIRLDVIDDDSILDTDGTPLGGTGPGNGNFNGSQAYSIVKSAPKPGVPTLLSPNSGALVNTLRPVLDWKDSKPVASRYQIQIALNKTFTLLLWDEMNISTSNITPSSNLLPGKLYYWRVKAFNVPGAASAWSSVRTFKTPLAQPGRVSPTEAESLLTDRSTFEWNTVDGATSYSLQVSSASNFSTLLVNATTNSTTYTMTKDLPQNKTLYWRVRAKTLAVTGPWSAKWSFKTGNPPTVPLLVAPANGALVKDYTPVFNWNNSTAPKDTTFQYYEVQVDDNKEFSSPETVTTKLQDIADSDFTPLTDLASNTRYYWRVRAINTVFNALTNTDEDHTSGWSPVWSFRAAIRPPNGLTMLPNNEVPRQPSFDWDDAAGPGEVKSYTIQISTTSNFSILLINSTTPTSFYEMLKSLPSGKTIYWRVRVNGPNGPSVWTKEQFLAP